MTVIVAQRQGDEILLVGDTKITSERATRPDELPGNLKVITFADRMTAGFAGNAGAANVAIKAARRAFYLSGPDAALEVLKASSREDRTDYIVASHHGATRLVVLRNGGSIDIGNDVCSIGQDQPFKEIIEKARDTAAQERPARGYLRGKFLDVILTGKHGEETVGGFPIAVVATTQDHHYAPHTGGYTYKFPEMKWGETTYQPMDQVYSGDGHFELSIVRSEKSDVPVVGACLLQARTGYVYSPIEQPEPFKVELLRHSTWKGREQEMYRALRNAIEEHVHAVGLSGQTAMSGQSEKTPESTRDDSAHRADGEPKRIDQIEC